MEEPKEKKVNEEDIGWELRKEREREQVVCRPLTSVCLQTFGLT